MKKTIEKGVTPKRASTDERTLARTDFASEEDNMPINTASSEAAPYAASPDATPNQTDTADTSSTTATPDRETAIREAAYRRYEARGGSAGSEEQDWLDAQAEVDGS